MLIGYARVSKADGSQSLDLQQDALRAEGVEATNLYHDLASGVRDDRPGLDAAVGLPVMDVRQALDAAREADRQRQRTP